jgi:hypothetical protein
VWSGPDVAWSGPHVVWSGPHVVGSGPHVAWSGPQVAWSGPQVATWSRSHLTVTTLVVTLAFGRDHARGHDCARALFSLDPERAQSVSRHARTIVTTLVVTLAFGANTPRKKWRRGHAATTQTPVKRSGDVVTQPRADHTRSRRPTTQTRVSVNSFKFSRRAVRRASLYHRVFVLVGWLVWA